MMRDAHNTGLIYLGVRGIQKIGNPWDRVWIITIDCKKNIYNLEGFDIFKRPPFYSLGSTYHVLAFVSHLWYM